jgi:chemotaxis protein MotB
MRKANDGGSIIIVKKIKKAAHGHHGGSWKVAYADFVTAMMAFFMVMWIVGLDDQTRKAIEEYFSHAAGAQHGMSSGASPLGKGPSPMSANDARLRFIVHTAEQRSFQESANRLRARLDSLEGTLATASVEVTVGDNGLRIELIESGDGEHFFERGSATPRPAVLTVLAVIASELGSLQNPVIIEGHTDAARYVANASYTNWELSTDRANAARRILNSVGLGNDRITEVRGLADTRPRNATDPFAPENRRISLVLPFTQVKVERVVTSG